MTSVEDRAWELMVKAHGNAVHENPALAEALLPRYRTQAAAEAQE